MDDLEELLEHSIGSRETQEELLTLARQDPSQFKPEVIQLLNYSRYVREHKKDTRCPRASKITISTVSSIGTISGSRVLDLILLTEYLTGIDEEAAKRWHIEAIGLKKKKKEGKEFGNSMNIKLHGPLPVSEGTSAIGTSTGKLVNIILSQNGKMTLTGAKDLDYGLVCMKHLVEIIKSFPDTFYNVSPETMAVEEYEITMINTDFSLGFEVDQIRLYEILINEYPFLVTFNPEVYPGISIHYMVRAGQTAGVCNCMPSCLARQNNSKNGNGFEENDCREITCAIFQTGKVVITGSNTLEQVNDVYERVNTLLRTHYEEIVTFSIKAFPNNRIIEVEVN